MARRIRGVGDENINGSVRGGKPSERWLQLTTSGGRWHPSRQRRQRTRTTGHPKQLIARGEHGRGVVRWHAILAHFHDGMRAAAKRTDRIKVSVVLDHTRHLAVSP